ncbi:unnamed protein product [Sympodiomycopsis kandeliae]
MISVVAQTIEKYCPKSWVKGEASLTFGNDLIKAPDLIWTRGLSHETVGEITWAHESIRSMERQLFKASSSGRNAIAVKGWFANRSGNSACANLNLDMAYQDLSDLSSILLMIKSAGSTSIPQVWRFGAKAQEARLDLPHSEQAGDVAWLPAAWFTTANHQVPLALRSIGDAISVSLLHQRGGSREVRRSLEDASDEANTAAAISAITNNDQLDEATRARLIAQSV